MQGEDPQEYEELLAGLQEQYQPIGMAEDLEVERTAISWWRLKRAWRYEDVANRIALRDVGWSELGQQIEHFKGLELKESAVIEMLQDAEKEIERTGEISQSTRDEMFLLMPEMQFWWPAIEQQTEDLLKFLPHLSSKDCVSFKNRSTVRLAISLLEDRAKSRNKAVTEISIGQYVVPAGEAFERVLRYGAAIERDLNRALDRLERLQRRRRASLCLLH